MPLYIPIWFYSNVDELARLIRPCIFTFQSGSILIEEDISTEEDITDFTFQSGSILIK